MLNQKKTILHVHGYEYIENSFVLKEFLKFVRNKSKFIQVVMCCHCVFREYEKTFYMLRFVDNGYYQQTIMTFYEKFGMTPINPIEKNCEYLIQNLNKLSYPEIRNICMDLTKTNFPFLEFYKYVVSKTSSHTIIQKAAMCEHLSNVGNKKIYYFEHFLFFIKDGDLSGSVKI